MDIKFGNLQYLWLFWSVPLLVFFYIWAFKRKTVLIERFVSAELKDRLLAGWSPARQRTKAVLLILAILCAVIALTRPKYGFHWEEVKRRGVDIVIALDVSRSMLAEDVSPNRLERAKREIIDLFSMIEGDRVGLVAFSGTSFLQCPLTLDYGAVRIFLDELTTDLIPVPGTAVAEAIDKAVAAFDPKDRESRVVILITDGEDHEGDPIAAAKRASEKGVKIYAIGIGKSEGAPIPNPETGGFKKDSKGELILSKLGEETLQRIALATGGSYVRSVTGGLDLEKIYQDIRKNVEEKDLQSGRRKRYEERYQWPLFVALLIVLFEAVLRESKRRRDVESDAKSVWRWVGSRLRKKSSSIALLFVAAMLVPGGRADAGILGGKAIDGETAYKNGKYADALQKLLDAEIDDPKNYDLKYNLAASYYKMGDYQNAEKIFQDVIVNGAETAAQKSWYNLGNTYYRQGKLQEAVAAYQKAIDLDPKDEDAKANLEFVREEIKRRIEEQKQRNEQQQQQQNQQQGDEKKDDKKQQQDQNQDKKEGQQKQDQDGKQQAEEEKKDQEQQSAGAEEQKEKQDKKDGEQAASAAKAEQDKNGAEKMSEEEAARWLSTLKEDRKDYLKKRLQGGRQYRVEKDW